MRLIKKNSHIHSKDVVVGKHFYVPTNIYPLLNITYDVTNNHQFKHADEGYYVVTQVDPFTGATAPNTPRDKVPVLTMHARNVDWDRTKLDIPITINYYGGIIFPGDIVLNDALPNAEVTSVKVQTESAIAPVSSQSVGPIEEIPTPPQIFLTKDQIAENNKRDTCIKCSGPLTSYGFTMKMCPNCERI